MSALPGQETLDEAMAPATSRIWQHTGCGGWVRWFVRGGFCLRCQVGPLHPGEYAKPGTADPVAEVEAGEAA